MKAPDKIYVREFAKGLSQMWSGIRATETSATAQHEYIRKEALMEWAKGHQEGERQGSYTWSCYQIFIDKLNEM